MKTSLFSRTRRSSLASFARVALLVAIAALTPLAAQVTVTAKIVTTNGMSPTANGESNRNWNFNEGSLTSFNGWQYLAFWNNDGATNGGQYHVSVARRQLPDGDWQVITLSDYFRNQDTDPQNSVAARFGDGHEKVALGVSPDGHIHLSFDHHVDFLHYRRTANPVAANPETAAWNAAQFAPVQRNLGGATLSQVTYPSFYADYATGNFALYFRSPGGSGNGDSNFSTYRNGVWLQQTAAASKFIDNTTGRSPDGHVNAYPFGIHINGNTVHATWCWRETPDGTSNFDLCHAFSTDFGATWRDGQNNLIGTRGAPDNSAALISADDPGVAGVSLSRGRIQNGGTMAIDAHKNIHVICDGPTGAKVHYMRRAATDTDGNPFDHGGTWLPAISVPTDGIFVAGPNDRLYLVAKTGLYETSSTNPSWSNTRVANAPADATNGVMNLVVDDSRVSTEGIITVVGQNNGTKVTSVDYNIGGGVLPVSAPAFSPAAGTYFGAQTISLTTGNSGASIRYTTDGSEPSSTNGTLYAAPFSIAANTTLKAIAYKTGSPDSPVSTANYIIRPPAALAVAGGTSASANTPGLPRGQPIGRRVVTLLGGQSVVQYIIAPLASANLAYSDPALGLNFVGRYAIVTDWGNGQVHFYVGNGTSLSYLGRSASQAGATTAFTIDFAPNLDPVIVSLSPVVASSNLAPTIGTIADLTIDEDTDTGPIPFTIGDPAEDVEKLTLSATSSNPALVPVANILFDETGANRTLTAIPANDQFGTTLITVTVSDGTLSAQTSFTLTVTSQPEPVGGTLYSLAADASVRDNNGISDITTATTLLGAGGSSPFVDRCTVYVFQLPDLGPVANPFSAAALTFHYSAKQGTLKKNDLYGLGRRAANTVLTTDYHGSTTAIDITDATLLQVEILTNTTPLGLINTSLNGSVALTDYLNAQYANGAGIGQYVFLRLNTSEVKTAIIRATLTMSEGGLIGPPDTRPRLDYTLATAP